MDPRPLIPSPDGGTAPDIVCTLDGGEEAMAHRLSEWAAVTGRAQGRQPADGGVTLVYDHDNDLAADLARLAAAEFDCCSFFTFTLTIDPRGMRLTVTAPPEAAEVVTALFGAPEPASAPQVRTISRDDLRTLLDTGSPVLVEALPTAAYDAEHLPGAVNVPGELTPELAGTIAPDRSRTVVVYCSGPACGRSRQTAAAFSRLGHADVRVYPGGKADWWDAGLPLQGTRTAAPAR